MTKPVIGRSKHEIIHHAVTLDGVMKPKYYLDFQGGVRNDGNILLHGIRASMKKPSRYEKLLERVADHWQGESCLAALRERHIPTLASILAKRLVKSKKDLSLWHPSQRTLVKQFAMMPTKDRILLATEYLQRHPPPPTFEEQTRKKLIDNPWGHVFALDTTYPGANLYDGNMGEFYLDFQKPFAGDGAAEAMTAAKLVWRPMAPWSRRKVLPFVLDDLSKLGPALVKLAASQGMAFKVDSDVMGRWNKKYSAIYVAKGDLRLAKMADPGCVYEVVGIPPGQAILFDKATDYCGLIAEYKAHGTTLYGVSVWERFYAVELEDVAFSKSPEIAV